MARGDTFTARVERIAAGGAGVARLNGKAVFVGMTAPGDLARCRITGEHARWAEAELLEVLESSPLRADPACPLYGRCGGCSLQHLNYDAQIEAKAAILADACTRVGKFKPPEIRVRRSAPYEYRNRVQFHRAEGRGGDPKRAAFRPGFKERKGSGVVPLKDCPVADKGIREALKEGNIPVPPGKDRFTVYSRFGALLSGGTDAPSKVSVLGKELAMDPGVFFQSNIAMLELLIEDMLAVAAAADKGLPLADIYCGVGTFAAFLGPEFQAIDLVEENKTALSLARRNMPRGKKADYYPLTDTAWAQSCPEKDWGLMVLDPPRDGLSKPFGQWLAENGPGLVVYVSCDPAALARDGARLLEGGYTLTSLALFDFYPQTAHIESLAVFWRGNALPPKSRPEAYTGGSGDT
jgi:23S rRNA (uracil1939-C5)-methyltransferase